MPTTNIFSNRVKLTIFEQFIRRVQTLPAPADASNDLIYALRDANGVVQRAVLRDVEEMGAFFGVTVADLGGGHRGYAGAGYSGLASGYAVNQGGMSGYTAVGAISEQFRTLALATFTRVGTYTISGTIRGFGSHNGNLYRLVDTGANTRIIGFNPATGAEVSSADATPAENAPQGFTVFNGVCYFYGSEDNRFWSYDIDSQVWTQLTTVTDLAFNRGLAHDGTNVYTMYRNSSQELFIAQLDTATGALSGTQRMTGFEADDTESSTEGFAEVGDKLYITTQDGTNSEPHIYEINPATGALTVVGDITPANADMVEVTQLGNYLYALNRTDGGVYRSDVTQGNRWVVIFPTATTEVADTDTMLRLRTEQGGTPIELTRDAAITDAVVFASAYDGAAAHTVNVGDTPEWALYNAMNVQLFQGGNEAVYSDFDVVKPTIPIGT